MRFGNVAAASAAVVPALAAAAARVSDRFQRDFLPYDGPVASSTTPHRPPPSMYGPHLPSYLSRQAGRPGSTTAAASRPDHATFRPPPHHRRCSGASDIYSTARFTPPMLLKPLVHESPLLFRNIVCTIAIVIAARTGYFIFVSSRKKEMEMKEEHWYNEEKCTVYN
nr:unnamed protein product [Callosobruchus analis]